MALLRFSDRFVSEYDLKPGSRLITVNTYEYHDGSYERSYETDLAPGPAASGNYRNFSPFIADFLTDDLDRLAKRKATIGEDEWRRTEELGETYVSENYARPFWDCSVSFSLRSSIGSKSAASPRAAMSQVYLLQRHRL